VKIVRGEEKKALLLGGRAENLKPFLTELYHGRDAGMCRRAVSRPRRGLDE